MFGYRCAQTDYVFKMMNYLLHIYERKNERTWLMLTRDIATLFHSFMNTLYIGILMATPLAPGPYSTHLDCALRLMPDASHGGHMTLSGRYRQLSGQHNSVN